MSTKYSDLAKSLNVVFHCYYTIMERELIQYLLFDFPPEHIYEHWRDMKILCRNHNEAKNLPSIKNVKGYGTSHFNLLFGFQSEFQMIKDNLKTSEVARKQINYKWDLLTNDFVNLKPKSAEQTLTALRNYLNKYPDKAEFIQPAIDIQQQKIDNYHQSNINEVKW